LNEPVLVLLGTHLIHLPIMKANKQHEPTGHMVLVVALLRLFIR